MQRKLLEEYLSLDISVFVNGLLCEYVRYCRGLSNVQLDDLHSYTQLWIRSFLERRLEAPSDGNGRRE